MNICSNFEEIPSRFSWDIVFTRMGRTDMRHNTCGPWTVTGSIEYLSVCLIIYPLSPLYPVNIANCLDPHREHVRSSHPSWHQQSSCDHSLMTLETAAHTCFFWIIDVTCRCSSTHHGRFHPCSLWVRRRGEREREKVVAIRDSFSFSSSVFDGPWRRNVHLLNKQIEWN